MDAQKLTAPLALSELGKHAHQTRKAYSKAANKENPGALALGLDRAPYKKPAYNHAATPRPDENSFGFFAPTSTNSLKSHANAENQNHSSGPLGLKTSTLKQLNALEQHHGSEQEPRQLFGDSTAAKTNIFHPSQPQAFKELSETKSTTVAATVCTSAPLQEDSQAVPVGSKAEKLKPQPELQESGLAEQVLQNTETDKVNEMNLKESYEADMGDDHEEAVSGETMTKLEAFERIRKELSSEQFKQYLLDEASLSTTVSKSEALNLDNRGCTNEENLKAYVEVEDGVARHDSTDSMRLELQPCDSSSQPAVHGDSEEKMRTGDNLDTIDAVIDQLRHELEQEEQQKVASGNQGMFDKLEAASDSSALADEQHDSDDRPNPQAVSEPPQHSAESGAAEQSIFRNDEKTTVGAEVGTQDEKNLKQEQEECGAGENAENWRVTEVKQAAQRQQAFKEEVAQLKEQTTAFTQARQQQKNRYVDIWKMIHVDSLVLNYASFYPCKMLGSNLTVGNLSDCEQIVELSVDSTNQSYSCQSLKKRYNVQLPFSLDQQQQQAGSHSRDSSQIDNSEVRHEAWFIENPVSKELTKRITLKLGPKAEQDFIIVVRAPSVPKTENLLSFINISLLTYSDERFGVDVSFEDFLKEKFNSKMKAFLQDRRKAALVQRMEILLAGQVQVPKLICHKALTPALAQKDLAMQDQVIPLVVKKIQGMQRFRIPFKNMSEHEFEVEFEFLKASQAASQPALARVESTGSLQAEQQSPIEFTIVPACVKIPAGTQAVMLNISAKLKNSYLIANDEQSIHRSNSSQEKGVSASLDSNLPGLCRVKSQVEQKESSQARLKRLLQTNIEKYNHLLVGKVRDTKLMFSFFIEASIIDVEAQPGDAQ